MVGLVGGEAAPAPAMIAAGIDAAVGDLVQVGWTALRTVMGEVREVTDKLRRLKQALSLFRAVVIVTVQQ